VVAQIIENEALLVLKDHISLGDQEVDPLNILNQKENIQTILISIVIVMNLTQNIILVEDILTVLTLTNGETKGNLWQKRGCRIFGDYLHSLQITIQMMI